MAVENWHVTRCCTCFRSEWILSKHRKKPIRPPGDQPPRWAPAPTRVRWKNAAWERPSTFQRSSKTKVFRRRVPIVKVPWWDRQPLQRRESPRWVREWMTERRAISTSLCSPDAFSPWESEIRSFLYPMHVQRVRGKGTPPPRKMMTSTFVHSRPIYNACIFIQESFPSSSSPSICMVGI